MDNAPERIWAWAKSQRSFLAYEDKPAPPANPTEYIRMNIFEKLEHEAGTHIEALEDRVRVLEGAATETLNAYDAVEAEAARAQKPGANAWSSAPVIRLVHAYKSLRAALQGDKE